MHDKRERLIFLGILLVVLGFGTWKLSESPVIWGDEGMLIELAVNLVRHGDMAIQLAPGEFISASLMSSGFPLIAPVAASLKLFGMGLLQARAVMVVYMLLCVAMLYVTARRLVGARYAAFAALLVATFPPFYGNGRNVLGEIPGMFFLFAFLYCVHALEAYDRRRRLLFLLAGLTAGLCVVTKPIFLTLLPAIIGGFILTRKKPWVDIRLALLAGASFLLMVLIWLKTQFHPGDPVDDILSFYANPYQLQDIPAVIAANLKRFIAEGSPIYVLGLYLIWSAHLLPRLWKNLWIKPRMSTVPLAEAIAYAFAGIVLIAYVRTPGWYRYFFPAQMVVFAFAPTALFALTAQVKQRGLRLWERLRMASIIPYAPVALLSALILFQGYQTAFNSWVANSYKGTITRDIIEYLKTFDTRKSVFTLPELVVFLPTDKYYQYVDVNGFTFGEEQLVRLSQGVPDVLIIYEKEWDANREHYPLYQEQKRIARYVFAERVR